MQKTVLVKTVLLNQCDSTVFSSTVPVTSKGSPTHEQIVACIYVVCTYVKSNLVTSNLVESNLVKSNLVKSNLVKSNLVTSNLVTSNLVAWDSPIDRIK